MTRVYQSNCFPHATLQSDSISCIIKSEDVHYNYLCTNDVFRRLLQARVKKPIRDFVRFNPSIRHFKISFFRTKLSFNAERNCIGSESDLEEDIIRPYNVNAEEIEPNLNTKVSTSSHSIDDDSNVQVMFSDEESDAVPIFSERNHVRRLVEFVTAWDEMASHLPPRTLQSNSARRLISALKLAIPRLLDSPTLEDGRRPVSRAIAVATILAHLGMDVNVIMAGLLRETMEHGACDMDSVIENAGEEVVQLIKESFRVKASFQQNKSYTMSMDDASSKMFRNYCLSFYSPKAILIELASRLDTMRHLSSFPRWKQQYQALETLQIWSPLSFSLGAGSVLWELEDISFSILFSKAYHSMAAWLDDQWQDAHNMLQSSKLTLQHALSEDKIFMELSESVVISGRYKSLCSIIKKLLKDGRSREEVFDLIGLRLIIYPKEDMDASSLSEVEVGAMACYRAKHVIRKLWGEVEGRSKDYVSNPKGNGYRSLHLAVRLCENQILPPLEIQIRTSQMHMHAVHGNASHDAYKGGLSDPRQVKELKAIMDAVLSVTNPEGLDRSSNKVQAQSTNLEINDRDEMFQMFDRNGDGSISIEEVETVMVELGILHDTDDDHDDIPSDDAKELVQFIASNESRHITPKEFANFRKKARNVNENRLLGTSKVKGLLPSPYPSPSIMNSKLDDSNVNNLIGGDGGDVL